MPDSQRRVHDAGRYVAAGLSADAAEIAAACDWVERTLGRNSDHANYVALRLVLEAARRSVDDS